MTYLLEHCLLTISSLLHWVHFAASPSGHNTGFYLNVWYILFGWRMCEGPWTSAVLNCSASSQCTRWNFRLPKFCCFVPFPLLQQPPARMHARARDSIKPRLPRFTGVLSQAGAALALKMLLLRFIVLDFNFVLTNARLYLKRKGKKKKKKEKIRKRILIAICPSRHLWFHLNVAEQRLLDPLRCLKCWWFLFCISEVLCDLLLSALGAGCAEMPWRCLLASESCVDCGNWPGNLVGAKRVALNHFSGPNGHLWRITSPQHGVGSPCTFWK